MQTETLYKTVATFSVPDVGYEIRLEQTDGAPDFRIKVYGGDPRAPAEWEFEGSIGRMARRSAIDHFLQTLSEFGDELIREASDLARLEAEGS